MGGEIKEGAVRMHTDEHGNSYKCCVDMTSERAIYTKKGPDVYVVYCVGCGKECSRHH